MVGVLCDNNHSIPEVPWTDRGEVSIGFAIVCGLLLFLLFRRIVEDITTSNVSFSKSYTMTESAKKKKQSKKKTWVGWQTHGTTLDSFFFSPPLHSTPIDYFLFKDHHQLRTEIVIPNSCSVRLVAVVTCLVSTVK